VFNFFPERPVWALWRYEFLDEKNDVWFLIRSEATYKKLLSDLVSWARIRFSTLCLLINLMPLPRSS
jgi:hypothetical protein